MIIVGFNNPFIMNATPVTPGEKLECLAFPHFVELCRIMRSPDHAWFTGLAVDHPPEDEDKLIHLVRGGGLKAFTEKFIQQHLQDDNVTPQVP